MMHYANRAEALRTLVFVFEERGVFVTPDDLAPLAARVVVEHGDGTAAINYSPAEVLELAAELFPVLAERADCPHAWCSGERAAHASLDPAEWQHYGEFDELAPHAVLEGAISQTGSEAPAYLLTPDTGAGDLLLDATGVRALADDYERHAATLRKRARQLDALSGAQ